MLKSFLLLNPIYKYLFPDMDSNTVIITEERIEHIKEHHPDDYEKYAIYIPAVLSDPDYILSSNKPYTAVVMKSFNEGKFRLILKIKIKSDPPGYKNSILSFWKIGEKTWNKNIKNKNILYKKEHL